VPGGVGAVWFVQWCLGLGRRAVGSAVCPGVVAGSDGGWFVRWCAWPPRCRAQRVIFGPATITHIPGEAVIWSRSATVTVRDAPPAGF